MSLKEPTTKQDISRQRTGASVQFFVLAAAFLVVVVAMIFWHPWNANVPPPSRVITNGPNVQPPTTAVPTP